MPRKIIESISCSQESIKKSKATRDLTHKKIEKARQAVRKCRENKKKQVNQAKEDIEKLEEKLSTIEELDEKLSQESKKLESLKETLKRGNIKGKVDLSFLLDPNCTDQI